MIMNETEIHKMGDIEIDFEDKKFETHRVKPPKKLNKKEVKNQRSSLSSLKREQSKNERLVKVRSDPI